MQEFEGIIAVALEDNRYNVGKVVFVDVLDPWNPQLIQGLTFRPLRKLVPLGSVAIELVIRLWPHG